MEEKHCLCALNRIFGFEPKIAHTLLSHTGSASALFEMGTKEADRLLGPYSRYKGRICREAALEAGEELERLSGTGISFTGCTEEDYPELLLECCDSPLGLYVRSTSPPSEVFRKRKRIAIVGTRDNSSYGREWCTRIIDALAGTAEKPVIVSGLALGTDICAHQAALEAGLPTIAVMATGPEAVYPYRNRAAAERMAGTPGCALITDYPPGTAPLAVHFLRRNRIIAGLSDVTVLVESRIKGGGMMTSRLAFSYDREVFALPGRLDDLRSQGCNRIIREKIAEPITGTEDFLKSIGMKPGAQRHDASPREQIMSAFGGDIPEDRIRDMERILTTVRSRRDTPLDELAAGLDMDYSRLVQLAGMLEMEGFISIDLLQRCSANVRKSG